MSGKRRPTNASVPRTPLRITIEVPGLLTVSEANQREHYMAKARRKKAHTHAAFAVAWSTFARQGKPVPPLRVTLTRLGLRRIDHSDNLAGSSKGVIDGLARALGIDDGDERIEWVHRQEIVKRSSRGVRIEIEETP